MDCSRALILAFILTQIIVFAARASREVASSKDKSLTAKDKLLVAFRRLNALVNSPEPPQGSPFQPLLSKPKARGKIAIVGAGLAGLHMAYVLKKKGFSNVVVLEKDSRVGGKVMSIQHKGYYHEMGACYTSPDYINNVYALAKELGIQGFVPLPQSTVWLDHINFPLLFKTYVVMEIKKLTNVKTPIQAVEKLIEAVHRYAVLHRSMFGKYEGDMMLKPSEAVLSKLNKTMQSFLIEHRLTALEPVLRAAHTMQGYGQLDEISAIYGMMWNTPKFLTGMLARSLDQGNGGTDMFRNGFMQITDKLAAFADVRLNVDITNIRRVGTGITVKYNNQSHRGVSENFEYLIWAADAREAIKVFDKPTPTENTFFSRLRNTWFTTTLFDSKEQCRSPTPISYWLSNLYYKREHSVWARRNSRFVMTGERCNITNGKPDSKLVRLSTVAYQMGATSPSGTFIVNQKFNQHFASPKDLKIVWSKTWNYFPRFSVQEMADGILWKIAEHQGEQNTWFVGSSVVFESTKSVLEYNKLMMDRMML